MRLCGILTGVFSWWGDRNPAPPASGGNFRLELRRDEFVVMRCRGCTPCKHAIFSQTHLMLMRAQSPAAAASVYISRTVTTIRGSHRLAVRPAKIRRVMQALRYDVDSGLETFPTRRLWPTMTAPTLAWPMFPLRRRQRFLLKSQSTSVDAWHFWRACAYLDLRDDINLQMQGWRAVFLSSSCLLAPR